MASDPNRPTAAPAAADRLPSRPAVGEAIELYDQKKREHVRFATCSLHGGLTSRAFTGVTASGWIFSCRAGHLFAAPPAARADPYVDVWTGRWADDE